MNRCRSAMRGMLSTIVVFLAVDGLLGAEYTWDGAAFSTWDTEARWGGRPWEEADAVAYVNTGNPGNGVYAPGGTPSFLGRLIINTNGVLRAAGNNSTATVQDLRLNGGTLAAWTTCNLLGNIALQAPSFITGGNSLGNSTTRAVVAGSADWTKTDSGYWNLYVDAGGFTGRWIITGASGGYYVRNAATTDLGTSQFIVGSGALLNLRQNVAWALRNNLAGSGRLTTGETAVQNLTLCGSEIRPGDTAAGPTVGVFGVGIGNRTLTFDVDGTNRCRLVVDVVGSAGVAGTDYDQLLVETNGAIALGSGKIDLEVAFQGKPDLTGTTLIVLRTESGTLSGIFNRVTLTPDDWRATVNYTDDSVTLTGIYRAIRGTVFRVQ